ncbi:response regulator [bacterium]|nr:response regulator [candidate division CSSED10-310 bacterium]
MTEKDRTILVVDDDPDFLEQITLQLHTAGYRVISAGGREEAEKLLEDNTPDLAVVDLMMEDMDGGFVLSYHIKRHNPAIPVIMVTAVTSETGLEFEGGQPARSAWIKADAILAKPVRFEQLTREITRLLKD